MDRYPVMSLNIAANETSFTDVDGIIGFLKSKIDADPIAAYIAVFNHYNHTRHVEGGEIADTILNAVNIIFCFGQKLPDGKILAVRPRSIGVVQTESGFLISFMEAPMQPMNEKIQNWVMALKDRT